MPITTYSTQSIISGATSLSLNLIENEEWEEKECKEKEDNFIVFLYTNQGFIKLLFCVK